MKDVPTPIMCNSFREFFFITDDR